uniref:Uncharacterized protein n=1 Tax=Anguilla anguilla TaxID=7936 RepID=A0A0E9UMU2_ANGAN
MTIRFKYSFYGSDPVGSH